eukprot:gene1131-667_t
MSNRCFFTVLLFCSICQSFRTSSELHNGMKTPEMIGLSLNSMGLVHDIYRHRLDAKRHHEKMRIEKAVLRNVTDTKEMVEALDKKIDALIDANKIKVS